MLHSDQNDQLASDEFSHPAMAKLAAALRRNLPMGKIDFQPPFAEIVWEIWIFAVGGSDPRRLDASVHLAINDLRIAAHRITEMDEFRAQSSDKIKKAINALLAVEPSELIKRFDLKGRPTNTHADGVARTVLKYYAALYVRAPSHYQDGDFVNLLAQIFDIFGITARASVVARKCLVVEKSTVKFR